MSKQNETSPALGVATCSAESKVWQAMQLKADMFDYLCWLETVTQPEEVLGTKYLVLASDHQTCWGETYAEAVRIAMEHDKEIYDATAQAVLPNQSITK